MKVAGGEKGEKTKDIENRDNEDMLRRIISPKYPINPYELLGLRNFKAPRIIPKEEVGTPVQEFFRDATVFLTGGTGFLGQVLIEKLLRCCPHINQIYVLVRVKRNKSPADRFETILQDSLFDKLRYEVPNFREKISYVSGCIDQPLLGLSEEDRSKISNDVNIIYHCAATVKFNEMLAKAIKVNIMGTREVIKVARDVKSLKALLYVSTAYSFCNHIDVGEKLYPMHIEPEAMIELVEQKSATELETEVATYIKDWPNTYVFSKALAEWLILKEVSDLPVAILRPSQIISTWKEPLRGWVNNMYGPLGLLLGFGLGILHIYEGDLRDETVDMVPVDMVVNSLICATKEVALNHKIKSNLNEAVPIYNYANASQNPITWKYLSDICMDEVVKHWGFSNAIWYPSFISLTCRSLYPIVNLFLHRIPGLLIDFICILTRKEPVLTKVYRKLDQLRDILRYFRVRKWLFKTDNVQSLWKNLSPEDKEIFYFDIKNVDWTEYFQCLVLGVRVFLMKDDIQTLPAARKKVTRLYIIHQLTKFIFYSLLTLFGMYMLIRFIEYRVNDLILHSKQ
ncbi:hypothetical protein V9T40_013368 [Parthenolecanium corni]|uniref:Fatty acyl-CoA reductase n=1 Tax=Parthenolecanium corni TaxID=536013 RepID=A0AAN9Y529_9HEMI